VALRASRAGSCPGATSAAASCSRATGRSQSGRGSSRTR
jgi:hypothetical protein